MHCAMLNCSKRKLALYVLIYLTLLVTWNEFLLYYFHLSAFCSWPGNRNVTNQLNAIVLSDTHLLGTIKGHWFDKLRREWQMYRSFQTAVTLFSPDVVFILGDIFDEGQWASSSDFTEYVRRFHSMFYLPENSKLYVVTGNHDIGFHYRTNSFLYRRFDRHMNTSSVDHLKLFDSIYFVRINSMAMENDGCSLCNDAFFKIEKLANKLSTIRRTSQKIIYPIVLTHFPLFRLNESICTEEDSVPIEDKFTRNRQGLDCFSKDASDYLLSRLKPRLILNGHVHHSCRVNHTVQLDHGGSKSVHEWTVASFSWRNKVNPSFLLLQVTLSNHLIGKCFLPHEHTVILNYLLALGSLVIFILLFAIVQIKSKKD